MNDTPRQPVNQPDGGRAERPAERASRPSDPEQPCLNCGDPTPGEFCPTCGQRKVDVRVSVRVLMMDVLEDQFLLDRRLPRTLSSLLFKPGRLTVEYVGGRMASYIHPFRLYLTTSVIFFLLFSFLSLRLVRQATLGGEDDAPAAADSAVVASDSASIAADSARLAELDSALAVIETQLADASLPGGVAAALRMARNETRSSRREILARLQATEAAEGAPAPASPAPASPGEGGAGGVLEGGAAESGAATDSAGAGSETVAAGESPGSPQTVNELFGWDDEASNVDVNLGFAAADSALIQQVRRIGRMEPKQALEELVRTFLNYVPTMMFILLPIFAVVLKLLYIRRGRFYAEHFVFLLHVHAFVYLLSTAMLLLRSYVTGWLEALLFVWVLVYIYLAMRRVYGQGWFKTFVKYWILGWTYFWILTASIPIAAIAAVLLF